MFYLSLNKIKIINNRELLGKAEVQIMSFVNSSESDFPMLKQFFDTVDENDKVKLITDAASKVLSSRMLTPIYKIKDKQSIVFGDTGFIVYKSKIIPEDFSWMLLAVDLDEKTRNNAKLFDAVLTNKNIKTMVSVISKLSNIASPVSTAIFELTEIIGGIIMNFSKNDKDDQIGFYMSSYIRQVHYIHGKRDGHDIPDLSGNMTIDYTIFGYEETKSQR
jgi:hypothetical protein